MHAPAQGGEGEMKYAEIEHAVKWGGDVKEIIKDILEQAPLSHAAAEKYDIIEREGGWRRQRIGCTTKYDGVSITRYRSRMLIEIEGEGEEWR